ncbi:MAG: DUF4097 family beta strand repeat-containing protein [Lacunisphaera sp.]|nr:DUF4097 family beta strand repeat-containing protein [Lacunisphaera sp.]
MKILRLPALLLTAAFLAAATATRAIETESIKQSYPLAADGTIHLENVNGDITITAWDKPEVSLEAEKRANNAENLAKITLEIESTPAKLSIKTKYPKTGWFKSGNNASVRYRLMVPAGVRLQKIDSVNSDITVTGVEGAVILDTVNGTITAQGLKADARLDSVNGSLRAEFASVENVHDVKLDSVNGRAEVTLPKGASAEIKADSVNGRITVDQAIKLGKTGRHSLSGEIGSGPGPRIVLDTVNGGIAIKEK